MKLRAINRAALPAFEVMFGNGGFRAGIRECAMNWDIARVIAISKAEGASNA